MNSEYYKPCGTGSLKAAPQKGPGKRQLGKRPPAQPSSMWQLRPPGHGPPVAGEPGCPQEAPEPGARGPCRGASSFEPEPYA